MAKFDKQSLCQKYFDMTLLHAPAHYICIICAKYQKASVKALLQVDFLMYALSKNKHNLYLIGNRNIWLSSQSYHFVKINILASNFVTQMFNVYIVYAKYQIVSAKAVVHVHPIETVLRVPGESSGVNWRNV